MVIIEQGLDQPGARIFASDHIHPQPVSAGGLGGDRANAGQHSVFQNIYRVRAEQVQEVVQGGRAGEGGDVDAPFEGLDFIRPGLVRQGAVNGNVPRKSPTPGELFYQGFAGDIGARQQDPLTGYVPDPGGDGFRHVFVRHKIY